MNVCSSSSLMYDDSALDNKGNCGLKITIREAKLEDVKALTEVLTLSFHPAKGWLSLFQPVLKLGVYEDLRSRLRGKIPSYCCLVAVTGIRSKTINKNQIVGTIELSVRSGFDCHYLYISNLAVLESHRRQGIAQSLLLQCEEIASKWGYDTLNLHVLQDNHPAKQLYLTNGYEVSQTELTWPSWLFSRPQRLFLQKKIQTHVP